MREVIVVWLLKVYIHYLSSSSLGVLAKPIVLLLVSVHYISTNSILLFDVLFLENYALRTSYHKLCFKEKDSNNHNS